jgi:carbamoyl-phosphate synthase large subunit
LEVFFALEPDMIVQETLTGVAYDFDILNDPEGRAISVVCWRKSLSRMGETEQAETVHHPALQELGERLANTLGHAGPLDADLFVDEEGNIAVLEINLRFGGGYPVSHLAGADFPGAIVRMLRGEAHGLRMGDYKAGVVMMKELHVLGGEEADLFGATLQVNDGLRRFTAAHTPQRTL